MFPTLRSSDLMEPGHTAARTNTQRATAGQSRVVAFNLIGVALPQQPVIDALRRHWIEEIGGDKPGDAGPVQYPNPARRHACQQHERKPGGTENNRLDKIWLVDRKSDV